MSFKDLLLESVLEEKSDFGIIACDVKGKLINHKGKVWKVTTCTDSSATIKCGSDTKTISLNDGKFPNTFEFSLVGEAANESKCGKGGKKKTLTEGVSGVSFDLSFTSSNASMVDDPQGEISFILKGIARKITNGSTSGPVMDSDGNRIGKFSFEIDEDDDMDGQEWEAEEDLDESKGKGCPKCGGKMKCDEDGNCPECGAKMIKEAKVERIDIKVSFVGGNELTTGFNGTLADAKAYYKGSFNLGDGKGGDKMFKVKKVEQL